MSVPMFVTAFYRNEEGKYEKHLMYNTDFIEASNGPERDRWSLNGPKDKSAVIDHTPINVAAEQPLPSPPPAAVERESAAPKKG